MNSYMIEPPERFYGYDAAQEMEDERRIDDMIEANIEDDEEESDE